MSTTQSCITSELNLIEGLYSSSQSAHVYLTPSIKPMTEAQSKTKACGLRLTGSRMTEGAFYELTYGRGTPHVWPYYVCLQFVTGSNDLYLPLAIYFYDQYSSDPHKLRRWGGEGDLATGGSNSADADQLVTRFKQVKSCDFVWVPVFE